MTCKIKNSFVRKIHQKVYTSKYGKIEISNKVNFTQKKCLFTSEIKERSVVI